jgi:hypothetical protein
MKTLAIKLEDCYIIEHDAQGMFRFQGKTGQTRISGDYSLIHKAMRMGMLVDVSIVVNVSK